MKCDLFFVYVVVDELHQHVLACLDVHVVCFLCMACWRHAKLFTSIYLSVLRRTALILPPFLQLPSLPRHVGSREYV